MALRQLFAYVTSSKSPSPRLYIDKKEPEDIIFDSDRPFTLTCNLDGRGGLIFLELPRSYKSLNGAKIAASRLGGGGLEWLEWDPEKSPEDQHPEPESSGSPAAGRSSVLNSDLQPITNHAPHVLPIIGVALIHNGLTIALPRPNRHADCIDYGINVLGLERPVSGSTDNQGFYLADGTYLNNAEAFLHVQRIGQVCAADAKPPLSSEDLW